MILLAWFAGMAILCITWTIPKSVLLRIAPLREDMPDVGTERPALSGPAIRHLSLSDRMRRKALREARRESVRVARQIEAHAREFREAREGVHVG